MFYNLIKASTTGVSLLAQSARSLYSAALDTPASLQALTRESRCSVTITSTAASFADGARAFGTVRP